MKRCISLVLCLCMVFSLCACAAEEPTPTPEPTPEYGKVSFSNADRNVTVSAMPQKVITAGPNCTEVFCALGLADKVIGKCMENHSLGALSEYADAVDAIPTLSVGYPTAEQIIDSGCDFIYANEWIFDDDLTIRQLEDAGITVFVSQAATLSEFWQELRTMAKIFCLDGIDAFISQQTIRLEAVDGALGEISEPKKVFVLDSFIDDKLFTAGSGNIETECIAAAGGVNIFSELEKKWDAVEKSDVIAADPEYIIIHDYSGSDYEGKVAALKLDPELSKLDCVANDRFIRLSLEDAMPGMRCVPTVETVAHTMYSELF